MTIFDNAACCTSDQWLGQTGAPRCVADGRDGLHQRPASVLVVDDDEVVCRTLKRILRRCADVVYTASNKAEALSILDEHLVSILVCDFNLGENEPKGTTLTEQLRHLYPSIYHAVIFTGEGLQCIPRSTSVDTVMRKGKDEARLCAVIRRRLALSPLR